MNFRDHLQKIQTESASLVWWKPEQILRGEHLENNPTKGERPWIIPETTGQFLYDTILQNKCNSILELGTSIGYSTIWIASALKQLGGHVHTIERSFNKIPVALKNFKYTECDSLISLHEGSILEVIKEFDDNLFFNLVFMDADRGHYHEYFPLIKRHLMDNAIIIADNAGNMQSRMQPFLDLLTQENWNWEIKDIDNGILIATKKAL